jgi:hypothetical protein
MRRSLIAPALALALLAPRRWRSSPRRCSPTRREGGAAREVTKGLRCLVCRNESIDDSNADFAKTLRLLVRERIVAGDSADDEAEHYTSSTAMASMCCCSRNADRYQPDRAVAGRAGAWRCSVWGWRWPIFAAVPAPAWPVRGRPGCR